MCSVFLLETLFSFYLLNTNTRAVRIIYKNIVQVSGKTAMSFTVLYSGATWITFKLKLKKKNIYILAKWNFLAPKRLHKTFFNFLSPKNLIKLFYTLDKTLLGETGCLSNLYYLLQSFTKYLRLILGFMWNSALRKKFISVLISIFCWY